MAVPVSDALVFFGATGDLAAKHIYPALQALVRHQPLEIALGARAKQPGEEMVGEAVELVAREQPHDAIKPYERLLGDAMRGDAALFAREDTVEEAWRIVDPILDQATSVHLYEPTTWGPAEADKLVARVGGWHNPAPVDV